MTPKEAFWYTFRKYFPPQSWWEAAKTPDDLEERHEAVFKDDPVVNIRFLGT